MSATRFYDCGIRYAHSQGQIYVWLSDKAAFEIAMYDAEDEQADAVRHNKVKDKGIKRDE